MNETTVLTAHKQWSSRPASERFATLAELHAVTNARKNLSRDAHVRTGAGGIIFEADHTAPAGQDLVVRGQEMKLVPTAWSLEQLSWQYRVAGLDKMIAGQPADLAAANLNWALAKMPQQEIAMLWANGNDGIIRGFNSTTYARLWDADVVGWVRSATNDEQNGWHRPPAYTDNKYPSGYYASDRDVFMFLVNDENRIDDGSDKGLGRGFIVRNTEVNGLGFHFSAFLYRYVCGNHMIWGHQSLFDFKAWHMGKNMGERVSLKLSQAIGQYLNQAPGQDQAVIALARNTQVGKTVEEAIRFLSGKAVGFNGKQAQAIVQETIASTNASTDPTNAYALFNGATSLSQKLFAHANDRYAWDATAARIIEGVASKIS